MISQRVRLMSLKRYFLKLVGGKFADGNPLVRIHANVAVDRDKSLINCPTLCA